MLIQLLVLAINLQGGLSYPQGAPTDACADMVPGHYGTSAQQTPSPYSVETSSSTYKEDQALSITLTSDRQVPFKGFLLQIREVDTNGTISGLDLDGVSQQLLMCDNKDNAAITHTSNEMKYSERFVWFPPEGFRSPIKVWATVVQHFDMYWIEIQSPIISYGNASENSGAEGQTVTSKINMGSETIGPNDNEPGNTQDTRMGLATEENNDEDSSAEPEVQNNSAVAFDLGFSRVVSGAVGLFAFLCY